MGQKYEKIKESGENMVPLLTRGSDYKMVVASIKIQYFFILIRILSENVYIFYAFSECFSFGL